MKLQILRVDMFSVESEALTRSLQHIRPTSRLPTGNSVPARGLSWCPEGWGCRLPPRAKPAEPGWVPTGLGVARLASAHTGTSARLAEEDKALGLDRLLYPCLLLGKRNLSWTSAAAQSKKKKKI